jgi:hypothetical protein
MKVVTCVLSSSLFLAVFSLGGCSRSKAAGSRGDSAGKGPPIACDLSALSATERQREAALLHEIGTMTKGTSETPEGYALQLRADAAGFQRVAEWITLERRCCPFLSFELVWKSGEDSPSVRLGGRPGVKEFLAAEIGGGS